MKVLFDTSVLVSAVVDQLPRHAQALACFVHYTSGEHRGFCTTHALAEAFATLTALPLPRRISPADARRLIEANFTTRLTLLPLGATDYTRALERVANLGLTSGIIYDALHLLAAEGNACQRLCTYNLAHFTRLQSATVTLAPP